MKVALISYAFAEYCVRLANGLAGEADVLLMLPQDAAVYRDRLERAVRFAPFHQPRLRQPARQLWSIVGMLRRIRHFDPDVVHIQAGHLWFNLALPLLRRRYPTVLTIHDVQRHVGDRASNVPDWFARFGYRQADRIIVHGERLHQQASEVLGLPAQHLHITAPVPDIVLGPGDERPVAEIDNTVLFFGRIWPYKGLEHLIRAEPLISARVPDVRIVIAGQGEDFTRYRQMMANPARFTVHNERISHERRAELFQQASLVVLPYIEASVSGVIPVAYTYGRPVVATTVGILPEMVDDGRTGALVPPCDPAALAEAVVRLLLDRRLRHEMGARARQKLATVYAPEVVGQQTMAVYKLAQSGPHARGRGGRIEHAGIS